jgi:hypothetical protein
VSEAQTGVDRACRTWVDRGGSRHNPTHRSRVSPTTSIIPPIACGQWRGASVGHGPPLGNLEEEASAVDPSNRARPVETCSTPASAPSSCSDDSTRSTPAGHGRDRSLWQWWGGRVGADLAAAAWRQGRALACRRQRGTRRGRGRCERKGEGKKKDRTEWGRRLD